MPPASGQAFRRARLGAVRQKGLLTPRCFQAAVLAFVAVCVIAVLTTLYVIVQGQSRGIGGDGYPGSPKFGALGATEFRRPTTFEAPEATAQVAAAAPAVPLPQPVDTASNPSLRRAEPVAAPPAPVVAAPASPQRRRKVLLSEGMGRWNTGVWPNWGSPDVTLNCELLRGGGGRVATPFFRLCSDSAQLQGRLLESA